MSESASKRRVVLISAALVASLIANAVLAWVVVMLIRFDREARQRRTDDA